MYELQFEYILTTLSNDFYYNFFLPCFLFLMHPFSSMITGGMPSNQIVGINMLHMQGRVGQKAEGSMMGGMVYASSNRAPPPNQFLRQSPSPSAPSPGMGGPSPVPMGELYCLPRNIIAKVLIFRRLPYTLRKPAFPSSIYVVNVPCHS